MSMAHRMRTNSRSSKPIRCTKSRQCISNISMRLNRRSKRQLWRLSRQHQIPKASLRKMDSSFEEPFILEEGDIVTIGADPHQYRVTDFVNASGIHMWRLQLIEQRQAQPSVLVIDKPAEPACHLRPSLLL